ncbi:uncharacterized protein B0P05DRAFT_560484, partial [Gilbertella persicaria]|uniref:uncharacterized protein n=1 Tax=Gilbertella persicaria TaxID=101096 RepID=UPI002220E4F6
MAIIRQVRFSIREPLGNVSFAFVYICHTLLANGSFFSCSGLSCRVGNSESES